MTPFEWVLAAAALIFLVRGELDRWVFERHRSADNKRWADVLNAMSASHAEDLQQLVAVRNGQIPASMVTPAVVTEHADPEVRLGRQIREDTILNGVKNLADMYRAAGVAMPPEDELRRQATNAIDGRPLV